MEQVVESVLQNMSSVKRPQAKFIASLFSVLMVFQGKANFRNLSRYCVMHEKRFSRWYRRTFDFIAFNRALLLHELPTDTECIAVIDASFMRKSGKKTEGLNWFYHSQSDQAEKGLEMSLICLVDMKANTAYSLDAKQTLDNDEGTRIDTYGKQVILLAPKLRGMGIRYLAADAYYSKIKFVRATCGAGLDMVGKLRCDAHLRWLYTGSYSGLGRPKLYDGKIDLHEELERFDSHGTLEGGVGVYSKVVNAKAFKRAVKLVLLRWEVNGKVGHALLFSTDLELGAMQIVAYYKARFQIEFLFRDGKQFTGLMDCQSCSKEAIHTHINASLTALNVLKLQDRRDKKTDAPTVISIASWRRKKFNEDLMDRLFERLELDRNCEKVARVYDELSHYGAIAA
jgi:hypothetical protein